MAADGNGDAPELQPRAPDPHTSASTMAGASDVDASSVDGSGVEGSGGSATVLTSQRRSLVQIKRVTSRVPVRAWPVRKLTLAACVHACMPRATTADCSPDALPLAPFAGAQVREVQEQPLLSQARKLLQDQKAK